MPIPPSVVNSTCLLLPSTQLLTHSIQLTHRLFNAVSLPGDLTCTSSPSCSSPSPRFLGCSHIHSSLSTHCSWILCVQCSCCGAGIAAAQPGRQVVNVTAPRFLILHPHPHPLPHPQHPVASLCRSAVLPAPAHPVDWRDSNADTTLLQRSPAPVHPHCTPLAQSSRLGVSAVSVCVCVRFLPLQVSDRNPLGSQHSDPQ